MVLDPKRIELNQKDRFCYQGADSVAGEMKWEQKQCINYQLLCKEGECLSHPL